jgi:hypothetical protein
MLAWFVKHRGAATVHDQIVTGNESAGVAGQIQSRFGDVIGNTGLQQRD